MSEMYCCKVALAAWPPGHKYPSKGSDWSDNEIAGGRVGRNIYEKCYHPIKAALRLTIRDFPQKFRKIVN
jgi:hypothetical protein